MGDPRRLTKKYDTPGHPWQKARIEHEVILKKEYGLKNKKEIYKMTTLLKGFSDQAKRLIAATGDQSEIERKQLFARMEKLGLLSAGSALDDVLSLNVNNLLDRRLQTIVFRKGLARSMKQSRQFISHNHITVGSKILTAPSYIVKIEEEGSIVFKEKSPLSSEEHPERAVKAPEGTVVSADKDAPLAEEKGKESETKQEKKDDKKTEAKVEEKAEVKKVEEKVDNKAEEKKEETKKSKIKIHFL